MNNGNERRNRRRQKASRSYCVRYDRILAVVLVLIVLIVILTSCVKSCSKDDKNNSDSKKTSQSEAEETPTDNTIVDNLQTSGDTSAFISSAAIAEETTLSSLSSETHSSGDMERGDLILVNASNEYKFPAEDTDPVTLYDHIKTEYYSVSDYVIKLDSNVITQLNSLMEAFYEETHNKDLTVIGGYRTLEEQNDRYSNGNSIFQGGYTDYHTARTFDLGIFPKDSSSGYYSPTGTYAWFDEHAAEYGFILRFPKDKESYTGEEGRTQTYRYVGVPHAVYIKQNGLCLEEYIDELRGHYSDDPIVITADSKLYNVYYVPSNGTADTEIPVPMNKTYTVSGNNSDGFIVTVLMN